MRHMASAPDTSYSSSSFVYSEDSPIFTDSSQRSRNVAQARYRAKRKAYVHQLERTVAILRFEASTAAREKLDNQRRQRLMEATIAELKHENAVLQRAVYHLQQHSGSASPVPYDFGVSENTTPSLSAPGSFPLQSNWAQPRFRIAESSADIPHSQYAQTSCFADTVTTSPQPNTNYHTVALSTKSGQNLFSTTLPMSSQRHTPPASTRGNAGHEGSMGRGSVCDDRVLVRQVTHRTTQ
ncbi:hypothetical protein BC629DRAFT_611402 [Irpex lacteus]|nr:hypothetical protein BC629DRAFT_611402 [Irpex lacteus]